MVLIGRFVIDDFTAGYVGRSAGGAVFGRTELVNPRGNSYLYVS